ncbi:MAG TPA: GNAT family N-acetyltransferase [Burkholderiaceae bacterium]|nr:GNAT family N-acetyltransferase [Burkholderiaceae bacterium]
MTPDPVLPRIELGSWETVGPDASRLRFEVFVDEQKVPAEIELDEHDPVSLHALARDADGRAVGTGRLLPDGHIGRVAVGAGQRRRGVGDAIMRALMQAARERGLAAVELSAQVHAAGFYRRLGFIEEGDVYLEAGIEHVTMRRRV